MSLFSKKETVNLDVTGMHCEKGTAGKNAVGPSMRNRFQTPRTDGTEANG